MIKQFFSKQECDSIIESAEKSNNWEHKFSKGHSFNVVSVNLDTNITDKLKSYVKTELNLNLLRVKLLVIKYYKGEFIAKHVDRNNGSDFNKDFVYNINIRLNNNYTGGEFYLNDKIFEAGVGDIYHYKSDVPHEVKPVKDGVRYICLFYIKESDLGKSKII